jgi:hypothetical protein
MLPLIGTAAFVIATPPPVRETMPETGSNVFVINEETLVVLKEALMVAPEIETGTVPLIVTAGIDPIVILGSELTATVGSPAIISPLIGNDLIATLGIVPISTALGSVILPETTAVILLSIYAEIGVVGKAMLG